MEELVRRIKSDWFDIKEASDDVHKLEDVIVLSLDELKKLSSDVRLSVEQGVTEYKSASLAGVYSFIEALQYDSKGFEKLADRGKEFSKLVYLVLLQRLLATGRIEIKDAKTADQATIDQTPEEGMKEILRDIQERIAKHPDFKLHPSVKNIFMQVNIYKKELANMKQLAPNILPEKSKAFFANFKNTFAGITANIQENYKTILKEEEKEAAKEVVHQNPLKRRDLSPVAPLLFQQAQEFSIIRSTLLFAGRERYKTRDILKQITERKERVSLLITSETKKYKELSPDSGDGRMLSRAFGAELIKVLTRQITRMS